MSGNITFYKSAGQLASIQNFPTLPLAKDIDTLNIYINKEGGCVIAESAGAATFVADGVSNWMVSKMYAPTFCGKDVCVTLFLVCQWVYTFLLLTYFITLRDRSEELQIPIWAGI